MVMRMLCGAWLVPAASLIWIGLAAAGLRESTQASQHLALGRTQAAAVVLAVFTVLIGASVFIRQGIDATGPGVLHQPPAGAAAEAGRWFPWLGSHLLAAGATVPLASAGVAADGMAPLLFPAAALCGFWAGLALPRALVRYPGTWSGPLAALGVGMSFQLTIGWLHLAHLSAAASPLLVVEGLILAWGAASAARVDPFAVSVPALTRVAPAELVSSTSSFSPGSAQPSIPEVAVGR